jgi:acetyltransferase
VAALIVALSRLGETHPEVVEVDLNPVVASANGAVAVDALVVLGGDGSARSVAVTTRPQPVSSRRSRIQNRSSDG